MAGQDEPLSERAITTNATGGFTHVIKWSGAIWQSFQISVVNLFKNIVSAVFVPQVTPPTHTEGQIYYSFENKSFECHNDISDVSLSLGEEIWARFINKSGGTLSNGKAAYVSGTFDVDLTMDLAIASNKNQSIRALGLITNDPLNDANGYVTRYGAVRSVDTSAWAQNTVLYLSPDTAGELTATRPKAPNYIVRIGIVIVSHLTEGVIGVDTLAFNGTDTEVNIDGFLNGTVIDTPQVDFSVSGGIIYADVTNENSPTKKLPFILDGDIYFLDTLTGSGIGGAARAIIPPGASATEKQTSFLYIYLNGGVPTLATATSEPVVPYALIAYLTVFDAVRTLADGEPFGYRRHNNTINRLDGVHDGAFGLSVETINAIRFKLGSNWLNGQDATPDVDNTTIQIALSAGIGSQFRRTGLPAFNGLSYLIYNTIANLVTYEDSINLTDITQDASGDSLLSNNTFYTIRIFYQLNSNGIGNNVIATRPIGHYSTLAEAIQDPLNYTVNVNDTDIEEIVYALYDLVISRTGAGGATITLGQLTDLRTKLAGGVGGGGASGGGGTDDKVRVSANDTTNDYLNNKIAAGDGISLATLNPTGNEQLQITRSNDFPSGLTVDSLLTYLSANGVKFGDGDTGLYESADGTLHIYIEGATRWQLTTGHISANIVGGIDLARVAATATVPCYTFLLDPDTGIGRAAANELSLIAGGVEVIRGKTTGAYIQVIKSGATQAAAGANAGEMWKTLGHATLPDNVIMHGV